MSLANRGLCSEVESEANGSPLIPVPNDERQQR